MNQFDDENDPRVKAYGHFRGVKLSKVLPVLQQIAASNPEEWIWWRNGECKYISLHIDTRDGGFCTIQDRDGNMIPLDQLERQ